MTFTGSAVARRLASLVAASFLALNLSGCGGGANPNAPVAVVDPAAYLHAAGQDFNVLSGGTAPLFCQGPTGTTYLWVVDSNGGLPLDLSSYSTQKSSFVAPTVTAETKVTLICRMTNGTAAIIDSKVTITVQPKDPPVAVVDPAAYVHAAGLDFAIPSGSTAPLYCQGPTGTTYQWIVESNAGLPLDLSSYSTQKSSFAAPTVTANTRIVLVCRMTNGTAANIDSRITVTVQPKDPPVVVNPADYIHAAGLDFNIAGGKTAPFYCLGPTGSTYQWVVESNASLPIELASYNTQQTSFTAPVVTQATAIVLVCRITFNVSTVLTSRVTATILPAAATPQPVLTLVSGITGNRTVLPGQRLALSASATWYDDKAAVTTGPLVSYTWTLGSTAPTGTVITPQTGSKDVEVIIPSNVTAATFFSVTVTETAGDKTSSTTITVLVDPNADLTLSITPQAQTVSQGAAVSISTTSSSKFFYQWTVVSGTAVTLGGATTNTVGFIAPATAGDIRLRVAIGYAPITADNPGVYFLDSVVTVR